jgi:hypothetical protein
MIRIIASTALANSGVPHDGVRFRSATPKSGLSTLTMPPQQDRDGDRGVQQAISHPDEPLAGNANVPARDGTE